MTGSPAEHETRFPNPPEHIPYPKQKSEVPTMAPAYVFYEARIRLLRTICGDLLQALQHPAPEICDVGAF